MWEVASGILKQFLKAHQAPVSAVVFSPDGRLPASASDDKTIKLWDAASGEVAKTLSGHENKVTCLAFSPDGRLIASGSRDQTIKLWRRSQ